MFNRSISEHQVLDALLRADFLSFLQKVFHEIAPGASFSANWHHEAIAWCLDDIRAGTCTRLIVTMPPRNLKSIILSVAWPAWVLGHHPDMQMICVSYNQELASKLARDCRTVMMAPWYRRAFPKTIIERSTEHDIVTTEKGGRMATSIGGTLTGRGADIIIIDDPLKSEEAMSATERNRVNEWFGTTLLSRLNNKEVGIIIVVMQRLHEKDLAGHLLGRGGWNHLCLAAIAEAVETVQIGEGRFHTRQPGDILHEAREGRAILDELKVALGSAMFAAQYQQAPVPAEGNMIRREWLKRYDAHAFIPRGGQIVQSWDTASKNGPTTDWSVCVTVWRSRNEIRILDIYRARLAFPELLQQVVRLARQWKAKALLIEDAASGQQLIQMLQRDRPSGVPTPIARRPESDKITRLAAQSARVEAGDLWLPNDAPWLAAFENELLGFPNSRHDDQVDALVQCLAWDSETPRVPLIVPPLLLGDAWLS